MTQGDLSQALYGDRNHLPNLYGALMSLVNKGFVCREGDHPAYYALTGADISFVTNVRKEKSHNKQKDISISNKMKSKINFIHVENPYTLDYIVENELPALTRKNADFMEAVVSLDSNYGKDNRIVPPDDGFNISKDIKDNEGKYCGSIKYWFTEMQKEGADFENCLLGAITSVDRGNSTHLEASEKGRIKIKEIIMSICKNVDELKNKLNEEFTVRNDKHLIALMSVPLIAKKKNGKPRMNLSFASKFCAYASKNLKCEMQYSKYDNVVSKALPMYCRQYLGIGVGDKYFDANYCSSLPEPKKYKYKLEIYQRYVLAIDEIITSLREYNEVSMTKEELDHIIWYGFKG